MQRQNISTQEVETKEKYQILYIGQSDPNDTYRTIFDRLSKHEKILKIYRDYNSRFRNIVKLKRKDKTVRGMV